MDKFDYLCRDSYNVGIKTVHFDSSRLIESCRVLSNEVCFHSKNDYNIYGIFQSRYKLFKDVYTDAVSNAVDYMVAEALLEASGTYKYLDYIYNPKLYVQLTDCILESIEHSRKPVLIVHTIRNRSCRSPASCSCGLGDENCTSARARRCSALRWTPS